MNLIENAAITAEAYERLAQIQDERAEFCVGRDERGIAAHQETARHYRELAARYRKFAEKEKA